MLSFFPRDVLDEIWDLIGSVSGGFLPTLGSTEDKANTLNYFFASVFTVVGDSEIKSMSLKSSRTLTDAVSSVDKIEKLLTSLRGRQSNEVNFKQ